MNQRWLATGLSFLLTPAAVADKPSVGAGLAGTFQTLRVTPGGQTAPEANA